MMTKLIIFLLSITISITAFPQNVGIGTVTPAEKLDVAGNINIQGNLKVKGDAGQPGQVLRVNNDGTQSWANSFGYKNRKEFTIPGITTWTVPAGVREIMIECVGGGGGGAFAGGGGAGAYSIGIAKVAPGTIITVNVGNFGEGASSAGSLGGFGGGSLAIGGNISSPEFTITSGGGGGASTGNPGAGGNGYANGDSLLYFRSYSGGYGAVTTEEYTQLDATTYITARKWGNGGACPYNPVAVSTGGFYSFNSSTFATYRIYSGYPLGGDSPGYGGAGNVDVILSKWGIDGGRGLIAISW
ncbi:MAG: hypothetical protein JNM19_12430 [Chitinophagaceae bacterium]|nr:hypothetical protein [Chitinophagaceae bacterium]